ncbi:hypothetical protein RND81_06G017100 [Saponaria officinalis]|uniref:TF-B3 domain-containing protein n=1 Tax=Saponaria officinalis TaxID=3572 RepID=A0AAW1K6P0_SAPOF
MSQSQNHDGTYYDVMGSEGGNRPVDIPFPITVRINTLHVELEDLAYIYLDTQSVENHILPQLSQDLIAKYNTPKKGVPFVIHDVDTHQNFEGYFLKHEDNKTYLKGPWASNFIQRRNLAVGDRVGFLLKNGVLQFKVIAKA